ncbi:hypothetical protein IGB42_00361 [Andreprevotia sp. IGB-42]|uniref:SPOR domain-containing protein n=1 Tax=Andreprevotia sp. IGB-42 TaxID=2497473 RepID=UPI00135939A3|nr:SPOR domain-containing protein [Andreprevotia sp. IGB-42]KAF0815280.1 hypothetical protein IGB42_00361 [Andreprevotia sp. IGB-42]
MKFGLILLVLVFGASMLVLGVAMPASAKTGLAGYLAQLTGQAKMAASVVAVASGAAASKGAGAGKAASASASAPARPAAKAIAASAILLPPDLPAKGQYALQVGRFADAASAEQAAALLAPLHVAWRVIMVVDQWDGQSAILAVGPYGSVGEARAAQPLLDTLLHGTTALPVILLPAAPA